MTNHLIQLLSMNGHGWYVWSAYACVFILLSAQWVIAVRRSR